MNEETRIRKAKVQELLLWVGRHKFLRLQIYLQYSNEKIRADKKELEKKLETELNSKELFRHQAAQDFVTGHFANSLHASVFLMAYALFEESLVNLCLKIGNRLGAQSFEEQAGYGLERYKSFLRPILENILRPIEKKAPNFSGATWNSIKDASLVRGILIHASGNLSITKRRDDLKRVIRKNQEGIFVEQDCVCLKESFVLGFMETAMVFLDGIIYILAPALDEAEEAEVSAEFQELLRY